MAINSKAKGKAGELELSHKLQEYGFAARRSQQFAGMNGDADLVGLPHIHIECKRVEKLVIEKAMEQSRGDAKDNEIPVVMHRKNRQPWLVTMDLETWMKIYKGWLCQQKET